MGRRGEEEGGSWEEVIKRHVSDVLTNIGDVNLGGTSLSLLLHNLLATFWEKIGTSAVLVLLGSAIDGLCTACFIGVRPHAVALSMRRSARERATRGRRPSRRPGKMGTVRTRLESPICCNKPWSNISRI
ncbi:hypothetical protein DFH09DRAFT_1288637, partial [Mycena vulgaris]